MPSKGWMVLCRAVDTRLLYFGLVGCPFVSTDLGVSVADRLYLVLPCAWVMPSYVFIFILFYSLYIVADVEVLNIVRDYKILFRFLQPDFDKPLDADAHFRRAGHQLLVQLRPFHVGEDFCRPLPFYRCRFRVLGGSVR